MSIVVNPDITIENLNGDADRGGWQANIQLINNQALAEYARHTELWVRPEANGVTWTNYQLALDGSLFPNNMMFTFDRSTLPSIVSTSDIFLGNGGLQGIYFSRQAVPANRHQIADMTLGKIIRHILTEHTNITTDSPGGWVDITGIDTEDSTDVDVYTVRESASIWNTIKAIGENEFYIRYFTKKDKFIYRLHPQFDDTPFPITLEITEDMIVDEPELVYRFFLKPDQVHLYGLTDTGDILESKYPAQYGTEGRLEKNANLRCNSQGRLDFLAERVFGYLSRSFDFRVTLFGPWGIFLELYDRVAVTYSGTDVNGVTINWNNKIFWIKSIDIENPSVDVSKTILYLEEEVT